MAQSAAHILIVDDEVEVRRLLGSGFKAEGYTIQLDYLMLPTVEHSIRRVADRVAAGGHDVPEADLRRRFKVSLQNLFSVYRPVVDTWTLHANEVLKPRVIAYGTATYPSRLTLDNTSPLATITEPVASQYPHSVHAQIDSTMSTAASPDCSALFRPRAVSRSNPVSSYAGQPSTQRPQPMHSPKFCSANAFARPLILPPERRTRRLG